MQETADSVDYPVRLEADYPESPSRWRALLGALFLIKGLLLLPHSIVLFFLGIASFIVFYIGYWAVLITGRYPRGMFNFVLGVQRWSYRTSAWFVGLTDRYPPFSLGVVEDYALRFEVDYPESSSRWRALLGALLLIKGLLLIPHLVIVYFLDLAGFAVFYIAYWVVLFTGRYPRGMFDFVVGVMRWGARNDSWLIGLTDRYPPFDLK